MRSFAAKSIAQTDPKGIDDMGGKLSAGLAAAVVAIGALASAPQAKAQSGVKAGVLTCNVDSGWGFVFGSSRKLKCIFSSDQGPIERYSGHVNKFGVDIGFTSGAVIVWGVFASAADIGKGAIAGQYGGVTGGAAVGVGAGANVLVGGSKQSVTLQPVSIQGNAGLNVAAGIAGVTLEYRP
jgi:uncharacterized protein DUF992